MFEEIDAAAERLKNLQAGWASRREGADLLGKSAARAICALNGFRDEIDVDVHRTVNEALSAATEALRGVKPGEGERSYTLHELAEACAKPGKRTVTADGEGIVVMVQTSDNRSQRVYLQPKTRSDGINLIRVYTRCGRADANSLEWTLKANERLVQGAFALTEIDGHDEFIIVNCFVAGDTTPREMVTSVKELGFYGDWIEKKLTGKDEF